jgi:hypothetical protein
VRRSTLALAALVAGLVLPATSGAARPANAAAAQPDTAGPTGSVHGQAAGSIGIGLLDVPASEAADPRARIYLVDHAAPGQVIHRRVRVINKSDTPMPISVYPGAATIHGGSFVPAAGVNDLTTWTTVQTPELTLPPGASAAVTVTIAVPRDAYPGERYAGIWAQTSSAPPTAHSGILTISRVGVRIYLAVGPGGPPAPNFVVNAPTTRRLPNGRAAVSATVRNSGGRALDLSGDLTLADGPGGLRAGPFPAHLGTTLAPGQSESVTVPLDPALPGGRWTAAIELHSGLTVRAATGPIALPAATLARASRPTRWPLIAAAAAAVVLLGAGALTLTRRRTRR